MKRFLYLILLGSLAGRAGAQEAPSLEQIIAELPRLAGDVLAKDAPERKYRLTELQQQREAVNRRDREEWNKITTREAWEKHRDEKVALLRKSLGSFPEAPKQVKVLTTKTIDGDGFRIENIVYESRPGLVVTANLYVPDKAKGPTPGIVIIHSHHNPKTQGELQDMGMTWARAGCLVLVPDMLGHGERRQHPFATDKSYPAPFKVGRQDYFFRYNLGVQLQLAGESLMGWMVWDLMRGIDVLLARPGIDRDRIIVLGSVAGGGDPAAVLAALDPRVKAVVPFNFGGAQPETKFPLPPDAEQTFNYMGGGSWESTRNLRLSARDGFLPWLIVAAAAPRPLIYAHEFAWDREHDPVWKRLQKIYGFYDATDTLAAMNGRGSVSGKPPEATHCNNIGAEHRKGIHPAFETWFGIKAQEYQKRVSSDELQCLTAEATEQFKPRPAWALAGALADKQLADARNGRQSRSPDERKKLLQELWAERLGLQVLSTGKGKFVEAAKGKSKMGVSWHRGVMGHPDAPGLALPVLFLLGPDAMASDPVVVGVAHGGTQGFLKHRDQEIGRLLRTCCQVCLVDLTGTGEMRNAGDGRGRTSRDTSISATEWMHGRTLLGRQVQELLLVLDTVSRERSRFTALWGDSFTSVNGPDTKLAVPHDAEGQPAIGEPMGGLVTLLAGLFAPPKGGPSAMHIRGGPVGYRSALDSPFFCLPHDSLVPGVLSMSDLDDVAAVWSPRWLHVEAPIDGLNQRMSMKALKAAYAVSLGGDAEQLSLQAGPSTAQQTKEWLHSVLWWK